MKIAIQVSRHRKTGWLVATSRQLPELIVQGKVMAQILERTPRIIRRILDRLAAA